MMNIQGDDILGAKLAMLVGDYKRATAILQYIEENYSIGTGWYQDAGRVAATLPDKTLAERFMQQVESGASFEHALRVAFCMRDKEAINRLIQLQIQRGLKYLSDHREFLLDFMPFNPSLARHVIEQLIEYLLATTATTDSWDLYKVGEMAAVLGNRVIASRAVNTLNSENPCLACKIAAVNGDIDIAEGFMWEYRKKDTERFNIYKSYGWLLVPANRYNPEAAFYLITALERAGYDIGAQAAYILQNIYENHSRGEVHHQIPESERIRIVDEMLRNPRYLIRPEAIHHLAKRQKLELFDKQFREAP